MDRCPTLQQSWQASDTAEASAEAARNAAVQAKAEADAKAATAALLAASAQKRDAAAQAKGQVQHISQQMLGQSTHIGQTYLGVSGLPQQHTMMSAQLAATQHMSSAFNSPTAAARAKKPKSKKKEPTTYKQTLMKIPHNLKKPI